MSIYEIYEKTYSLYHILFSSSVVIIAALYIINSYIKKNYFKYIKIFTILRRIVMCILILTTMGLFWISVYYSSLNNVLNY